MCFPVSNWNASDLTFSGPAPVTPVWGNPSAFSWPGPYATACGWPMVTDYPARIDPGSGALECSPGFWCGPFQNINYGYGNFDNIGVAFICILYCLTTSYWTEVMYQAMDCLSPPIWVFFCAVVIAIAWFAANLAIAVLYVQFAEKERKAHVTNDVSFF